MKILILGSSGMLGHMVKKYLEQYYEIETINHRWPSTDFKTSIIDSNADFLVNCVGAIPQRTKDFAINWELPIWLDKYFDGKIIHPGTDCEMDDDYYGNSKRVAAEWIKKEGKHTKILKTSIVGPELNTKASLMEWFLSQEGEINGYSECYWNGNTTLTWAQYCLYLISHWDKLPTENILEGECISKYNLLLLLKEIYNKNIIINPINKPSFNKPSLK